MLSKTIFPIFVGLVVASVPSPELNLGAIQSAPSPSYTTPPIAAVEQTSSYNAASASSSGGAAVTSVASADGTPNKAKRGDYNGLSSSSLLSSTTSSSSTSSSISTTSSSSTTSNTVTSTVSSAGSCPTTPEAGTFCGFINPEDPCAKQPDGYGPQVQPDTIQAFEAYAPFHTAAQQAKTPAGYVQTFKDLTASVSANSYLGLHTLQAYDTLGCSQLCDTTALCTGFNIYIERDPSLNPSDNCPLPSSITNYKCTLWGSGVEAAAATNTGGYRGAFQVVIVGSDGYEKTNTTAPVTPVGCSHPRKCNGGAIRAPRSCIGTKFFPGPYDVNICSGYAQAQNAYNKKHSSWFSLFSLSNNQCTHFNGYMVKRNGVAMGTYCALYSQSLDLGFGYSVYQPGWQNGQFWAVESSWVFDVQGDGKGWNWW